MEITKPEQLKEILKITPKEIAFDTESEDGLNYLTMKLAGWSFYWGQEPYYVNCFGSKDALANKNYQDLIEEWYIWVGTNYPTLIMSNAAYDMKCLHKYFLIDEEFKPICTVTAEKLINDTEYSYGLKDLTRIRLGRNVVDFKDAVKFGFNSRQFIKYAESDAVNVWDLWQLQKKELKEQNLEYLFYNVEMPFQFVIRDMEINGVLIDPIEREKLASEVSKRLYDLEKQMLQIFGEKHYVQSLLFGDEELISPINFNSNKQLVALIENRLGLEIKEKTDGKEKSISKESILGLISKVESEINAKRSAKEFL